ncbi:AI-2E family transporter [Candidatus Woesearchaeota archaeon]|nr:AI-2E family transporter [Candidatus Woesearchaeota archaeon]
MAGFEIGEHSKYFFLIAFFAVIVLGIFIVWPFLITIFGSIVLTYIFYPIYRKLLVLTKNKNLASFLVSLFLLLLLVVPIIIAANSVLQESVGLFYQIRNINVGVEDVLQKFISRYFEDNIEVPAYITSSLNKLSIFLLQKTDTFILGIPGKILNLFVMFFIIFFLFKDGKDLVEKLKSELPLKERYKKDLIKKFDNTLYATVYGLLVASFVQSILAMIGFYIFDVSSPLLLGFLVFISSMLPFLGAAFIWLPAAIVKLATGDNFNGIGLLIYGTAAISLIDNVIKVKVIEKKSELHPALALLGVLGGLHLFGLTGILLGPLSLALMVVFFDFYLIEKKEAKKLSNGQ